MKNKIIALVTLLFSSASCSKVIDIDYEHVDPMYVVVSTLSAEGGTLLLTQSTAMEEPLQNEPITTASVSVSSSSGELFTFTPDEQGVYQIEQGYTLAEGNDYTLTVEIDNEIYTSTSHLYATPEIADVAFSMQSFTADMDLVFCTFSILDIGSGLNYYRYRFVYDAAIDKDGEEPDWWLAKETTDGEPILLMTNLYGKERDVQDGDIITIEVQAIDKAAYDYLYTLNLSSSSSTNPTSNFSGNCLGYFFTYSLSSLEVEFYFADAEG